MIEHIKLKSYKGIESLEMNHLGHINVLCGKNNSGKSSILEAMSTKGSFGIGKSVDTSIIDLFKPFAKKYSTPNPDKAILWFTQIIEIELHKKTIWYDSEIKILANGLHEAAHRDQFMNRFDRKLFDYETLLKSFFSTNTKDFDPFLIPPKRSINSEKEIATDEPLVPTGEGIINKLFYLKNQDIKSKDYEVYKKIYDEFEEITGRNFNIVPKRGNQIELKFNNATNEWIPAKNSGLGLSDTLSILSLVNLTPHNCILIEEPESHLHAEYQKRLLDFFRKQTSKQFFLSTHSNIFLDPNIVDKVIYTEYNKSVCVSDVTSRSLIISSLGYSISDNLSSDLIILTEGTTDIPVFKAILTWKGIDLRYNIKYWPLGGDMMVNLDLEVLTQHHKVVAVIDSDFQSQAIRTEFISKCESIGIKCFQLERYAIENYFSLEAIRVVFPNQIPDSINKLSHKKSIKTQLGFNIKSKNNQIIQRMQLSDFEGTDLLMHCNEIEEFLALNVT
jgi:predicted ATP-dependent endonuclease of OLD family